MTAGAVTVFDNMANLNRLIAGDWRSARPIHSQRRAKPRRVGEALERVKGIECGSTLICETVGLPTLTDFHVDAFDHAELLRPTTHVFPEERLPWLHLADTQAAVAIKRTGRFWHRSRVKRPFQRGSP